MTRAKLLLVEDEPNLAEVISDNLAAQGYDVSVVGNGLDALERASTEQPELILLDVMLPGLDGFSVCERLRAANNDVPVLFLTAKNESEDRIHGLEVGGDDYLTKPFALRELVLRVRAILRRRERLAAASASGEQLVLGDRTIDFAEFVVQSGQGRIELSKREVAILRCLADNRGQVVARATMLDEVWGYDAFPTTRTIDNFIVRLRRVLEPDPRNPRYIHTIRGVGYRLTP